ncbi:uncharacterized protein [Branchiostoma lanceolatum]|uniref:uncharacterized protein isoform X1 n=1 Tax=Branchiostoma lanceolatum TaxID=7740 RepID=UPI0034522846
MRMAALVRLVQRNVLRKVALSHGRWTTAAFISLTLRREQSTGVTPLMRSVLVLKNSPRSLQNFREAQADVYNLDLEDGVPEGEKESALKLYSETLKSGVFRGPHSLYVRVSDPRNSATLQKEVGELCHPDVTGFILPKVTSADEVSRAAEVLTEMERANNMAHGHLKIIPVIECLDGYKNAFDIAKASRRISALAAGKGDFAACFLVPPGSPIAERLGLRVLQAAKAAGVNAIETPSQGDFDNFARIERDANRGKALGFDGMILLHPKLVPFANQLYSPSRREVDWAEHVTAGARVYQPSAQEPRRFIGPPMRPGALQILQRHSQIQALKSSTSQDGNENEGDLHTVTPLQRTGGLTKTTAGGGWTHGMVPVTLDSSWRAAWSSAFLNAKRLNSCNLAAQEIGLPGVQPPFHLLAMLVTGLAISKSSEAGHLHLGIYNMAQLRPVTDGDSVRALFSTNSVEEAGRSGRFTLVSHTHVLVNQHEETVFRLTRKGLYPKSVTDQLQVSKEGKDQNATQSELRDKIIRNVSAKENMNITASMPLTPNELYVHRLVKAFSPTETKGISNLMRATHPHIFNTKKFCMDDILVPGPMALAATVHNVADDFGDVLYETVVEATNPNRVNQEDVIGSVSFILDVQRLPQNSDLEEVTVRTLGIKNLDMDELLDRNIPVQLFTGNNMESAKIEKICEQRFPLLCRRIAVQALWKFLRLRPS